MTSGLSFPGARNFPLYKTLQGSSPETALMPQENPRAAGPGGSCPAITAPRAYLGLAHDVSAGRIFEEDRAGSRFYLDVSATTTLKAHPSLGFGMKAPLKQPRINDLGLADVPYPPPFEAFAFHVVQGCAISGAQSARNPSSS